MDLGVCDLRKPHTSVLMFLDVGAMSCEKRGTV